MITPRVKFAGLQHPALGFSTFQPDSLSDTAPDTGCLAQILTDSPRTRAVLGC